MSAGELLLPQDLDWTLMFVSFLRRYPSDTGNQIYPNNKTGIWNPILLFLIYMYCFIPDLALNFTVCSSILCSLPFDSTSENFEFRWSITGLILKSFYVLLSFLLSAKCRFWRISQKLIHCILNTVITYQIVFFQYSAIVGILLIVITKSIPRNDFSLKVLPW